MPSDFIDPAQCPRRGRPNVTNREADMLRRALLTQWADSLTQRTGPLSVLTIGLSPVLVMELPVLSSDGFAPRA